MSKQKSKLTRTRHHHPLQCTRKLFPCVFTHSTMELLSGSGVMKVAPAARDWAYVLGLLNALLNPVVYTQYDFNTRFNWLRYLHLQYNSYCIHNFIG